MWRTLDLFCGAADGWSLGLHRAGFTTVAACETWRRAALALIETFWNEGTAQ
jgi:DNA (cytosine-5)-methyltransferase 1